jgi:phosphatidylinositol alpha-1,6-mannosyltransferase
MRVLFLTLKFGRIGGLEIYSLDLVQALQNAGCDVVVWSVFDQPGTSPDDATPLAPRGRLAMSLYCRFLWGNLLRRKMAAVASQYDLAIFAHVNVLPAVYQASIPIGLPYWVWVYGIEVWADWSPEIRSGLEAAQCIGTISNHTKLSITTRLPDAQVAVIHNSVDTDRFRPLPGLSTKCDHPALLTVGRLSSQERYKGQDTVIRALPLVQRRLGRAVEYRAVGTGDDLPRLQRLAKERGVEDHVHFLGWVPDEDLVAAYQDCNVFVMPSKVERRSNGTWAGEGFGTAYIEASACGRPVVGSNQGGAAEALVDGVTGFAVDPTSVDAVADACAKLLADPALATRMGEAGRRFVVQNFSRPIFERRVAELLANSGLLARRNG